MTGIICLTLKYTVHTLLMNSEGSVRIVCLCIFMERFPTSGENNCGIKEGWPFTVRKPMSMWLWIIEYGIIKMTLFRDNSGKSKMPWLYPRNTNLNYFWICMNYMNISLETLPDAITLIHPTASTPSVFLCSRLSTPRTVHAVLTLGGRGSLPLNRLFASHLHSRRKLPFPKLGDMFCTLF